jgi:release factor glutamine methyltransferase
MRFKPESVSAALSRAAALLEHVTETPRYDAELLMAHAFQLDRSAMLLTKREAQTPAAFDALIDRRIRSEPVAYITGFQDFWSISLRVTPAVLIPRADSETLIEAAIDHFKGKSVTRILDLGTGSGALLLAALTVWPGATGLGIDASPAAVAVAQDNAKRLALNAEFRIGNWAGALTEKFDLILCNPPYIETAAVLMPDVAAYEPHEALFAGVDGLDDYARIAPQIGALIAPGGMAAVEIGHRQAETAGALFTHAGFHIAVRQDLGKRDRCLVLTR